MVASRISADSQKRKRPPATTPEAREKQMIALAMDLVEKKLREGSATSQETVHWLKLASSRNRQELEKLQRETRLLEAREAQIASQERVEELYANAIQAMKAYSGQDLPDEDNYDDGY